MEEFISGGRRGEREEEGREKEGRGGERTVLGEEGERLFLKDDWK